MENLFLPPFTTVLEEYGMPTALSLKLEPGLQLGRASGLDEILANLRALDPAGSRLSSFELEMIEDTRSGL